MHVFVLLGLLVLGAYLFFKKRYAYWKDRGIPYPEPAMVFGNTFGAIIMTKMMSKICFNIYNSYQDYAYVGMFNFWTPAILIRDIELVKDVLIKRFNNFHDNWITVHDDVDPVMAKNPFVMQGEEWKVVRTQLTPQYTGSKLKAMIPLMEQVGKNMVKYIKERSETKSNCFEAKELSGRFTGDTVLMCAYGLEGKSFVEDFPVAFKIGEEIASPKLSVQIKQTIGLFFPLLRRLLKVTFLGCPIPKVFWDMILGTMKYREENNIVRKDYLDFIRDIQKPNASPYKVTDPYAVAHAFTFFLDSFETSSISMSYTLFELAKHPDIQQKAREEVDAIFEKHGGKLTPEGLMEMEYMDNILSGVTSREVVEFFATFSNLGYTSALCNLEYNDLKSL